MAYALSALVLLAMSNAFPFMALRSSGFETVMTLPRTAVALYRDGYGELAVLVLAFIVGIPALVLITILALAVPLTRGRSAPWLVPAGRWLFRMNPWSMVEVFIIGVIVSLVKIGHMATVILGLSFWSYVGFALCFTFALASLDRLQLWQAIEESGS